MGAVSLGLSGQGMRLTTYLHLVPRLTTVIHQLQNADHEKTEFVNWYIQCMYVGEIDPTGSVLR
jgi:hypothetical protein